MNFLRGSRSYVGMLYLQPVRLSYARQCGVKARKAQDDIGAVEITERWEEFPLGDRWIAACRIRAQDGQPVVAELRVFPSEPSRPVCGGRWSAEVRGDQAEVPPGGLTARLLREVRIGEHVRHFTKSLQGSLQTWRSPPIASGQPAPWGWPPERGGFVPPAVRNIHRLGRKGRPDLFYAKLARQYVTRLRSGSARPVKEIATAQSLPQERVRDMIHEARKRGLLTRFEQGRPGGELTERCNEVLDLLRKDKKRLKPTREKRRRTAKARKATKGR